MQESKRTYTIAIMSGSIESDYVLEMKRGFSAGGHDNHVNTIFFTGSQIPNNCQEIVDEQITQKCQEQFSTIYQYIHFIKPDAIIITYGSLSSLLINQNKKEFFDILNDFPCLMLEDEFPEYHIPSITADNYGGMKKCVEHLINDHKFKNICFLSGPKDNYDANERLNAFLDTMKENHLSVNDKMVKYGEFSEYRDQDILTILQDNKKIDAIVCADDVIAKGCYRVCESQNLVIGKDIAITGFDDSNMASSMNPPLTSVSQNVFEMGYFAICQAVALCNGKKISSIKMPTTLRKRASCSCQPLGKIDFDSLSNEEITNYMENLLHELCPYFFERLPHYTNVNIISTLINEYCNYITKHVIKGDGSTFKMKDLMIPFKELLRISFFFKFHLLEGIIRFLQIIKDNVQKNTSETILNDIINITQRENLKYNINILENTIYETNCKTWFVPLFISNVIKDLYLSKSSELFINIMSQMRRLSFNKCYFLLFDEIVTSNVNENLKFPNHMHLISYFNEKDIKFFGKSNKYKIYFENGFSQFINDEGPMELSTVLLFADNKQYGILLCDIADNDIGFAQLCGIQLGSLFKFIELNDLEQKAQKKLQSSLKIISEQNNILNFLSKYDELTKLFNRRGFIEEAITVFTNNPGKKAYLIFGDLDHLKEINDIYGHMEGDYAIISIANRFKEVLPENAIIGRIGGDEFIAFVLSEEKDFSNEISKSYTHCTDVFNKTNDKPYFIEASFGIHEFICDSDQDFNELIKKSDDLLYKAKAHRRVSIKK